MIKELYLVRHGETLFNLQHRIQGACDSPLTRKGIQQAIRTGEYFNNGKIQFDHAYASTQERACDSLEYMTTMSYQRLKGIKEWDFGDLEGMSEELNPPMDPIRTSYGDYFLAFHGESDLQVQERVYQTLLDTMEKEDHESVLAVSHGGAIFMFLKKIVPEEIVKKTKFENCCILKFTYQDHMFRFVDCINEHLHK